ncbi:MAG: response regulator [Bacteroidota bacterium]|nr:response regulator [Bacteroidota bacterium]
MKTALVVDDSPYNRAVLSSILRKKNLKVEIAEDGEKAIELFKKSNPDVVFLDYVMPKMNGVETLRELRKLKPSVIAVMVTSISASEDVEEARTAGANGYVLKPYSAEKIYSILLKFNLIEEAERAS